MTRSMRGVSIAATETRDDNPVPGRSGKIVPEDAYIVSLKLRDYPDCEYWEAGNAWPSPMSGQGSTYLYDMKCEPGYVIEKPFHSLHFYVPASALNAVAEQSARGASTSSIVSTAPASATRSCITSARRCQGLRRPSEANQLFVDHAMLALTAHVAQAYGGLREPTPMRGGLAPWQVRRACERLEADLTGKFSLDDIATDPSASRSVIFPGRFASPSDYRHTSGCSANVDAAKQLMTVHGLCLPRSRYPPACQSKPLYAGVFLGGRRQSWRRGAVRRRAHETATSGSPRSRTLTRFETGSKTCAFNDV